MAQMFKLSAINDRGYIQYDTFANRFSVVVTVHFKVHIEVLIAAF